MSREQLNELTEEIDDLIATRDVLAAKVIREKTGAPYDPHREAELGSEDVWLPILRRVRTLVGADVGLGRLPIREPAIRGHGFQLIAGPCSVESEEHARVTCAGLSEYGILYVRGGCWKPRTFASSWRGHGFDAVTWLGEAAHENQQRTVVEILDPRHFDDPGVQTFVDVVQIGARNGQNYALLEAAREFGRPVLLKRAPGATVEEWLGASDYLGDVPVTLCERGVVGFDPCLRNQLDLPGAILARALGSVSVIVDPSHATGISALVLPLTLAAKAAGLDGAMVEAHPCPVEALTDAEQTVTLDYVGVMLRHLADL